MVVLVGVAFAFGSALKPAFSRAAFASAKPVVEVGMTVTLQPVSASPVATRILPSTMGTSLLGKLDGSFAAEVLALALELDVLPEGEAVEQPAESTSHCDRDGQCGRDEQLLA